MKLIAALAGLVIAALALLVAPDPPRLSGDRSGDAALATRVSEVIGDETKGYRGLSVAFVDNGRITTTMLGDPAGGPLFEIGSVQKVLTGMLLADLAEDGIVRPADPTGLPGGITFEELASQRAGLPRLAPGLTGMLKSGLMNATGGNPYAGLDVDALRDSGQDAKPGDDRGQISYSNYGMALLGQALADKAGKPYTELVTERILQPLGMTQTYPQVPAPAPAGLATGSKVSGREVDPWSGEGYVPAGIGPRSTAGDLAKLVAAVIDGSAPGASAADPRFGGTNGDGDQRIGYAWFTEPFGDRELTWHNGGTGGFSTFVGIDRATRQGVVVLGNTDRGVEWIGVRLLGGSLSPSGAGSPLLLGATILLLAWGALALPAHGFRRAGRGNVWFPAPDRLRAVATVLSTAAVLLFAHRIGAWIDVPPWLWALAVGGAGAGATALALRWRALPAIASGGRTSRWVQFGVSSVVSVVVLGLLA